MDKIKRQFKDFWQYYRLMRYGANSVEVSKTMRKWMAALLIVMVGYIFTLSQMGLWVNFFTGALLGAAFGAGVCTMVKPSALSVAPFSPKQRVVFNFLSALLTAIIISLFIFALSVIFALLFAFIAFCIDGENPFVAGEEIVSISGYGNAFNALTISFYCLSAYALFFLERGRNITIGAVVLVVCSEILALVMTNLCANAALTVYEKFTFDAFANVPELITNLAAPWAVIVVLGVMNALAIALAVILSVRRFKSDKV